MSTTVRLKVVTPSGSALDEDVAAVTARTEVGEFCLLPEHAPLLGALVPSVLTVTRVDGEKKRFAIDRGFFEGGMDHAHVITERCVAAEDLDAEAEQRELERIGKDLEAAAADSPAAAELKLALDFAEARLLASKTQSS